MKKGICNNCEYRHHCCKYPPPYETGKLCKYWKLGGCFVCQYYKDKFTAEEEEAWFKHGCESWFPTRCNKFKRDWKKTILTILIGKNKKDK